MLQTTATILPGNAIHIQIQIYLQTHNLPLGNSHQLVASLTARGITFCGGTRHSALLVVAEALPAFSVALETLKRPNAFEFRR